MHSIDFVIVIKKKKGSEEGKAHELIIELNMIVIS